MADTRDPRIEAVERALREFFGDGIANLTNRVPALATLLVEAADRAAAQTDTDAVGGGEDRDRCESCERFIEDDEPYYLWADDVKTCKDCGGGSPEHQPTDPWPTPDSSVSPTHGESEHAD